MADKKTPKQLILARAKELADAHNYESPLEYNRALRYYLNEVANVRSPYAIPATGEQTEDVQVPDSMLKRDGYGNPPRGDNENNVASHKEMGDKSFSDNVSSTLKAGIEGGRKMLAPIYHSVRDAVDVYSGKAALDEIEKGNKLRQRNLALSEDQGKMLSETTDAVKKTTDVKNRITEALKGRYNENQNLQDEISSIKSGFDEMHKSNVDFIANAKAKTNSFKAKNEAINQTLKEKQSEDLIDSEARARAKVESEYSGKSPDEVLAHYAKKYNRPDYKPASAKEEQSSLPTPAKEMSPYSIEAYNAKKQASMNANPIRK